MLLKASLWRVIIMASIHENIIFPTMPMQVAIQNHFALFHKLLDHLSSMPNGGEGFLQNRFIIPIQITACQRAAIISDDYSVWI